ncbi:hypothetical protein ACKI1I_01475 [Streptomyces turgidiscabies]|uniref:Uncharacterized protein n=1 Tax=Streptomyces turgidiscabies (strain Car8) TaxID=698760 RepID=L7F2D2_STRT8|nr:MULTISPECIES: hypothetical protein [Streptomyces]ELP64765.1 hypothetical protein STRTUCAR8_05242 [Streptomyces turgidiscabies Car8]MDX3492431.1 hypothetical protein [Streptomyces turgidiscabies]GAQ69274.1 hypothetical protein T45_00998 [Streptomyces turgidiscabies]
MQQHRAHPTRPAAVVLSALLAVLAFLLPVSAKSASRLSSTGTAAATATAQASATADAQRPVTVAYPVRAHAHAVPYPTHGFLGAGAGEAAPHRTVGGPGVAVAAAAPGASRGLHVCRPRGPPSRWSTEVRIDA